MDLEIHEDFFPPIGADEQPESIAGELYGSEPSKGDGWFAQVGRVSVFAKLCQVLLWHADRCEREELDPERVLTSIHSVPTFLAGEYSDLSREELTMIFESLDAFPQRDAVLDRVMNVARRELRIRSKVTPV